MSKTKNKLPELANTVVEALLDKKAIDIVVIDLRKLKSAVADFFVVCTGNSRPQVDALSDNVDRFVKLNLHEDPIGVEGKENMEWVLMDYSDVVVHIFQPEIRKFYRLEDLWSDAEIHLIPTIL
jgi:ribosome-associated protein